MSGLPCRPVVLAWLPAARARAPARSSARLGTRFAVLADPAAACPSLCSPCSTTPRALYSSDQSFPLAGAFAYSIYKLQSKRMRQNPEGPFLGNNPMIGAVLSTTAYIGLSCAVSPVLPGLHWPAGMGGREHCSQPSMLH